MDPATGIYVSGYSNDSVHPNYLGGMSCARAFIDACQYAVPKQQETANWSLYDPLNLAGPQGSARGTSATGSNGVVLATGITGNAPFGWSATRSGGGTAVGSLVARSGTYKQGQFARLAITATSAWDRVRWLMGGDDANAISRWDVAWSAAATVTYGARRNPTVANGYSYVLVTPGTTGGSEPTWPTQEGSLVTDNTVVWMCQRRPLAGEQVYAEVEIATSSLVGTGGVALELSHFDTTNAPTTIWSSLIDVSGSSGNLPAYLLPTMKLRTPLLTMPTTSLRYLRAALSGVGGATSSLNVDVTHFAIYNASRQDSLN